MIQVQRQFLCYKHPLTHQEVQHYALSLITKQQRILLTEFNLYLLEVTKSSVATSNKYSRILQTFLQWLINRYGDETAEPENVWLVSDNNKIKEWQLYIQAERFKKQSIRPTSKTIFDNASQVIRFYHWINQEGYDTNVKPKLNTWKPTKKETLLSYTDSNNKEQINTKSIQVLDRESRQSRIKSLISSEQIKLLLGTYPDPVFSCLFHLSMSTALRPEGCVKWPYIGVGPNTHIKPWEQMLGKVGKTFPFTVTEKRNKTRTIVVNAIDWKEISTAWMPLYTERRKLYKSRYGHDCPINILWLNKKGIPVTEKNVADATTYAKKLNPLLKSVEFYDARHWWPTMYVIKQLGDDLWKEIGLNAAVDEVLRNQMGHDEVGTTYKHYISVARTYLANKRGLVSDIVNEDGVMALINE